MVRQRVHLIKPATKLFGQVVPVWCGLRLFRSDQAQKNGRAKARPFEFYLCDYKSLSVRNRCPKVQTLDGGNHFCRIKICSRTSY